MATGKRYYWIKLKDSFMSSDEIDYLMSQPDGANYVVLYQMLCLKTINTNGCLVSKIGEMLIPYDAEKIQRECKWFPLSTVRLALTVYKQIGLIFENPDGTLSISDYQNMIGSETDWAAKNRKIRSNAANKELQAGRTRHRPPTGTSSRSPSRWVLLPRASASNGRARPIIPVMFRSVRTSRRVVTMISQFWTMPTICRSKEVR